MKFKKGQSGNINGRPRGRKNASTVLFQNILDEHKQNLIEKAIELAEGGELSVLNKLLDKIVPTLTHNKNDNTTDIKDFEEKLKKVLEKAKELTS